MLTKSALKELAPSLTASPGTVFAGIDVGKKGRQVSIMTGKAKEEARLRIDNSRCGFGFLIGQAHGVQFFMPGFERAHSLGYEKTSWPEVMRSGQTLCAQIIHVRTSLPWTQVFKPQFCSRGGMYLC